MKRILMIAACVVLTHIAHAQDNVLQLDEHNKYIYYKVVDVPGATQDSLYRNAAFFVMKVLPKSKQIPTATQNMIIKDKFLCYAALVKHENGEIDYTLNIECKDSKYRYWLTDFVFTPYQRDRYGMFVPVSGVAMPLETAINKIDKNELDGYLAQTGAFCAQLGEKLKKYMVEGIKAKKIDQPVVKKVVTDKW